MMDWTDRHDRYFLRLISTHILLYTEMITTAAILQGDQDYLLKFHPAEHPLALQLGGCDPQDLARCAKLAEARGYDEINLNVGCPSPRVQKATFGAALMAHPELVRDCVAAMRAAVKIPITVKTRIGIDHSEEWTFLEKFIKTVSDSGCKTFIIHARKAWLNGLSPKENREIPPLRYDIAQSIAQHFPHLEFIVNGGIRSHADIEGHLEHFAGIMIGREAYQHPYFLATIDRNYFDPQAPIPTRTEIIQNFLPYVEAELAQGCPLHAMTRHILGLFHGEKHARAWRRHLSEEARNRSAGIEVLKTALDKLQES